MALLRQSIRLSSSRSPLNSRTPSRAEQQPRRIVAIAMRHLSFIPKLTKHTSHHRCWRRCTPEAASLASCQRTICLHVMRNYNCQSCLLERQVPLPPKLLKLCMYSYMYTYIYIYIHIYICIYIYTHMLRGQFASTAGWIECE